MIIDGFIGWILTGVAVLVGVYIVSRVASYAHFRSKMEFLQKLANGGKDGET